MAGGTTSVAASALDSEKDANSSLARPSTAPKLRSCVLCRNRKVRCDKHSPCSNCRRANMACVLPPTDRPPRWARRLERLNNNVAAASNGAAPQEADPNVNRVMDRLRNLENLVKELSAQLEQAHATTSSSSDGPSNIKIHDEFAQDLEAEHQRDTPSFGNTSSVQKQFGKLVLQDASRSRYVSSAFWSRVNDELDGLKMDTHGLAGDETDSSEDEASCAKSPSSQGFERTPSERHAFLFRHNLSPPAPDLHELRPLPSQIPFLLDIFAENVNFFCQIVHLPTATKLVRELRGSGMRRLTPANEALMFSIYYAAVTSMEEDDVMTNFGASRTDLNLKYRLGLEHALAKADFLSAPDFVLVQAFVIFICLVRRHDSPNFVWMMTGLVIRMAQYLGLQRDGAHFNHLTPYEIEMRRRAWWAVCLLDLRAAEDQGTEMTIPSGSFDTKIPLNINNADIDPESRQMPAERYGVTDMSFARMWIGFCDITRQMMAPGVMDGVKSLEGQTCLLKEIYQRFEQGYMQNTTESGSIANWVGITIARLIMAKLNLILFLPALFSSSNTQISDAIRTQFLVSAIEVAEYNHALNAEQACRNWRWLYQSYTHWYAIVYLALEISRRPWSPLVERAWRALHSPWLIPTQTPIRRNLRMWVPLRKLMDKGRRHREAELGRLKADPLAAEALEKEFQEGPAPSSDGGLETAGADDGFRERWRLLVGLPHVTGDGAETAGVPDAGPEVDVFSNFNVDLADVGMELDAEVNWYDWVESAKGMEWDARSGGNGTSWS